MGVSELQYSQERGKKLIRCENGSVWPILNPVSRISKQRGVWFDEGHLNGWGLKLV